MWSYFKHEWRLLVNDENYEINPSNMDQYLNQCLLKVARHGTNLARGPISEIVLAIPGTDPL